MKPIELVAAKRQHLLRLVNQAGADGERLAVEKMENWTPRPKGKGLKVLLGALREAGTVVKWSSFDAIALPEGVEIDFTDETDVRDALGDMVFIEIKSANQERVQDDFSGFFFALTESEIAAAEALGDRHRVALHNKRTETILLTTVADIIARARSTNWQVSVQL